MTKKASKALEESIQHWTRLATGKRRKFEFLGTTNCALCKKFYNFWCMGCPVKESTGRTHCDGTPYVKIISAMQSNERPVYKFLQSKEFMKLAKVELNFLKSLREKR